jgi:hypothetical protein
MLPKEVMMSVDKLVAWRLILAVLTASEESNEVKKPVALNPTYAIPRSASLSSASK